MVIVVIRQLPRITNAQFAGRADLEVDARFDDRAVLGDRHALGAERGAAVDEGQVGVGFGVAEGMAPAAGMQAYCAATVTTRVWCGVS